MERRGSARTFMCGNIKSDRIDAALTRKYIFDGCGHELDWVRQDMHSDATHWFDELDTHPQISKNIGFWYGTYYESFVDSLMNESTPHWVMETNLKCTLKAGFDCIVKRLHLFRFPFDKNIIAIELDESDVDLNDLTYVHYNMREVSSYESPFGMAKFEGSSDYFKAVRPLLDMSPNGNYTDWVDTGGKLKAFQIVNTDHIGNDLLYELGTMSRIGVVSDASDPNSPSQSYYSSIMDQNTISVFRNWTALALHDTVTVVGKSFNSEFFKWSASYFRMIYIHALYQKICLFDINRKFRDSEADSVALVDEMKDIERDYSFPTISYNFLPQLIYEKIKHGLEIDSEREQIHRYVEQEGKRQEADRAKASADAEKKLQTSVLGLTFLTIGSVLYDVTSWIYDMGDKGCCYQIVGGCVSALVFLLLCVLFRKHIVNFVKNKWKKK